MFHFFVATDYKLNKQNIEKCICEQKYNIHKEGVEEQ